MYQLTSDIELGRKFSVNSKKYIREVVAKHPDQKNLGEIMIKICNKRNQSY
jgi:hypothetical protein